MKEHTGQIAGIHFTAHCLRKPMVVLLMLIQTTGYAQHWREITPVVGPTPPARANATAVYDPVDHRVVMFGGRGDAGGLNDVWALDLETTRWTELSPSDGPAPSPRWTPAGVLDEVGRQMVMWSGQGAGFLNDVWTFDLSNHTWTERSPSTGQPNIRYGVAAVFDPPARRLVTFAGFTDQGRFDDTWAFDVQNDEWTEVTPATGPVRRCLHTASYDSHEHRMIMYGGQRTGPLDDIWALDLESHTWTELTDPTVRPPGRYFATSVYDTRNHRLLVFGGNRGSTLGLDEAVWSFTLSDNKWHLLTPTGTPPVARQGAVAVYIESEKRMIVIGGRSSSYLNDVWSLDLESTPTAAEQGEAFHDSNLRLFQSYPNPFAATTNIAYEVPRQMPVVLEIYDPLGRPVRRLVDGMHSTGRHSVTWDGRDSAGHRLAAGPYLYGLHGDGLALSRWLVLANASYP